RLQLTGSTQPLLQRGRHSRPPLENLIAARQRHARETEAMETRWQRSAERTLRDPRATCDTIRAAALNTQL
ncbi:hypothetical protein, partial [Rubinisphaera sp. JC750]|uniref:hypothetical protein n=1 Tax=Rubinisphaera sp. JC750 TaxID=2898658 RepID=UPI001F2B89B1